MTTDKSLLTNAVAVVLIAAGFLMPGEAGRIILNTGLFALSGSLTNWLAIHMLFERVPGFYGSGVIPARFDDFKLAIRNLMMEQFFRPENIKRSLLRSAACPGSSSAQEKAGSTIFSKMVESANLDEAFDSMVDVIMTSSYGNMLSMFGGADALNSLREPFKDKMRAFLARMGKDEALVEQFRTAALGSVAGGIEQIVDQRLAELTPALVKDIIQTMIRKHLGWLVVWGGAVGGLIGLVVSLISGPALF